MMTDISSFSLIILDFITKKKHLGSIYRSNLILLLRPLRFPNEGVCWTCKWIPSSYLTSVQILCTCECFSESPTCVNDNSGVLYQPHRLTASLLPSWKGYREGFLWKRGRDNGQYLSRRFILSEREGVLKYFNKHDVSLRPPRSSFHRLWVQHALFSCSCLHFLQAREPKAMMKIGSLNATFQPSKIGTPHGLQITYLKDNSTRNIFVYHEEGKVKPVSAL